MRNLMRFSFLAGLLLLPAGALAQSALTGILTTEADAGAPIDSSMCEFYVVKAVGSNPKTDWQAHLFSKSGGGVGMGLGDFSGGVALVLGVNFTETEAGDQTEAMFYTCPNGQMAFDSGLIMNSFFGSAALQTVGNSILPGGLALPGGAGAYSVDFGSGPVDFPAVGTAAGSPAAINYAFAPLVEQNDVDQGGFTWGGQAPDPGPLYPQNPGFIIGYNVYRMLDGGSAPDVATLGTAANFVGFVPMGFDQTVGDPGAAGADAPADGNALGDFAGMQNADATAYTGDEIMLYQDGPVPARDGATLLMSPADPTMAYWYAVQPVVNGSVADFTNVSIVNGPAQDHTIMGGMAVDLNLDGDAEFFSPNETAGIPGLGLTHGGLPLLSPVALSDPTNLPASGVINLDIELGRGGVELQLNAALEAGNVLGYNVFRLGSESREQVNESLITARGGNGNSYELVDGRFSGRRARALSYEIDVVYNDGTETATFGPFEAEVATRGNARRSR